MSIIRMTSETCYHPSLDVPSVWNGERHVNPRFDENGNYKVAPCEMIYSAEEKTLTCPTCNHIERNVTKVSNYHGHEEGRIDHSPLSSIVLSRTMVILP